MKPIKFEECNTTLSAPDCHDLHVHSDGMTCTSVWELSDQEIEVLIKSRKVVLQVVSGVAQPQVSVGVLAPKGTGTIVVLTEQHKTINVAST